MACSCPLLNARYAPLELPSSWTFSTLTPAYNPDTPDEKLGDFQPGIQVAVIEKSADGQYWLVEYKRIGAPNIHALIPVPDLSKMHAYAFESVRPLIDDFPLLKKQLESNQPWPKNINTLANTLFEHGSSLLDGRKSNPTLLIADDRLADASLWGMVPLQAAIDYRNPEHPKIVLELWNKADAARSMINIQSAPSIIEQNLVALENAFETYQGRNARNGGDSGITAVRNDAKHYFLPNDLKISLRDQSNEYLIVEISPFNPSKQTPTESYDPETFAQTIQSRVKQHEEGYVYISGIPMITQGEKGYCAAATLARILNFYGYSVDMHAMADLAETEGRKGTTYKDVIASIRRVCNSTPFKIKQLKKVRRAQMLETIEAGIPIYWLIPKHARLIIGVHPEGGIVYSDSWGPGHEFKTMTWGEFKAVNREMWILEPKN